MLQEEDTSPVQDVERQREIPYIYCPQAAAITVLKIVPQ